MSLKKNINNYLFYLLNKKDLDNYFKIRKEVCLEVSNKKEINGICHFFNSIGNGTIISFKDNEKKYTDNLENLIQKIKVFKNEFEQVVDKSEIGIKNHYLVWIKNPEKYSAYNIS